MNDDSDSAKAVKAVIKRNMRWYTVHQTFREPLFWGPILILAQRELAHMPLSHIFYSEVFAMVLVCLLNVRAGIWADQIGHLRMMKVGEVFLILGNLIFATMHVEWQAWLANVLWAFGFSCVSGADNSYLHENLKADNRESEHYGRNIGSVQWRFLLISFTGIATGFLAAIDLRLPLFLSILPKLFAYYTLYRMEDPPPQIVEGASPVSHLPREIEKKEARLTTSEVFREAMKTVRQYPLIRWTCVLWVTISVVPKLWFFLLNDYYALAGIPLSYFGVMFFGINILSFISARYARFLIPKGREMIGGIVIALCIGLGPVVQGLFPSIFGACVSTLIFGRWLGSPIISHLIHGVAKSTSRATTQSMVATVKDIAMICSLLAFGIVSGMCSVPVTLVILGSTALVGVAVLIHMYFALKRGQVETKAAIPLSEKGEVI